MQEEITNQQEKATSLRDLKAKIGTTLDRELHEPENEGVIDLLDIVCEHVRTANREREVISFELTFLGLLHVLSEKGKRSKLCLD